MNKEDFRVTEDILASKNNRFINHLIDLIPQYAVMYFLAYFFFYLGEFTGNYTLNNYWNNMSRLEDLFFSYLLMLLYFYIMESLTNRSLGKYVTKTMVIMSNGQKPTNQVIFKRSLCRLIPFDALSFLGTNGKGWHDSMSKTYVVDVTRYNQKINALNVIEEIGLSIEEN